jgi:hypothetical protein
MRDLRPCGCVLEAETGKHLSYCHEHRPAPCPVCDDGKNYVITGIPGRQVPCPVCKLDIARQQQQRGKT